MQPDDEERIARLRARLRHVERGKLPSPEARREYHSLIAPHLPAKLAPLAADFAQIQIDDASGAVAPGGLKVPDKWFRAVDAEARARVADGNTESPFALSERRTATVAGVERFTVRKWRERPEYTAAVETIVEKLKEAS